ncbi:MAG: hypothetical protein HQL27_05395 [Candidatus Omnitrophica bacterium]|nr:hypothetical protein [Candidatus Omnitrophota bacterium]
MSNHHHQSRAEQIYNRTHGSAPFHYDKRSNEENESMKPEDIQTKVAIDDRGIQLRAYQLYCETGGLTFPNSVDRLFS